MICHNTIQLKQTFKVKNFYPSYRIQANSTVWQFFTHFWHVKVLSVNIAKGIYLGGLFSSPRKVAIVRGNFGKQNGVIRDRLQQYQYYFCYMLYAFPHYTFCQYREVGRQVDGRSIGTRTKLCENIQDISEACDWQVLLLHCIYFLVSILK